MKIDEKAIYESSATRIYELWGQLVEGVPLMEKLRDHLMAGVILSDLATPPGATHIEADVCHHNVTWKTIGAPTFRLTHGLAAGLILTDAGKLPWSDVPFPFHTFSISLPPGIVIYDDWVPTKQLNATYATHDVFYTIDRSEDVDRINRMLKNMHIMDADSQLNILKRIAEFTLQVPSTLSAMIRVYSDQHPAAVLHYKSPPIKPGMTMSDVYEVDDTSQDGGDKLTNRDTRATRTIARVMVNLAQYLSTRDESENRIWTPKSKPSSTRGSTTWDVGRAVKLPQAAHRAAASVTVDPTGVQWRQFARHMVRGHMHGYWYGPKSDPSKRELRKRWVEPFVRGPEDAPILTRVYDVDRRRQK